MDQHRLDTNLILTHTKSGFDVGLASILFYLAMLGSAFVYVMKNNCGHVEREGNRLIADAIACGTPVTADQKRAHAAWPRTFAGRTCSLSLRCFRELLRYSVSSVASVKPGDRSH